MGFLKKLFGSRTRDENVGEHGEQQGQVARQVRPEDVARAKSVAAMNSIAGLHGERGMAAQGRKAEQEFEEEIVWARKAIAEDPQFWPAHINLGNALALLNRPAEAEQAYTRARQLAPENPLPVYHLGTLAEQKGQLRHARDLYQESVELDPKFENGYFNLAAMQANLHLFDEAIAALEKLLELNPNAEGARAMLWDINNDRGR